MVERHVANVNVAGSNPVSRSFFGGVAKWLRQRSAKPLFSGSNPLAASSFRAGMAEQVDARDLKSLVPLGRAGSIPAPGTHHQRILGTHQKVGFSF